MHNDIATYMDTAFAPYSQQPGIQEIKQELLHDLQERYRDLKDQGLDDASAYEATISSIGDIAELVEGQAGVHSTRTVNLSQRDLRGADLSGTDAHDGRFKGSALKGARFNGANLRGSEFSGSDLTDVTFDGADLTNVTFRAVALGGATFSGCTLVDTNFSAADLRGVDFGGLALTGVVFDKAGLKNTSFASATLRNVSFKTTVKHAIFTGAHIDKITYAELQGMGAQLADVTII